MGHERLPQRVLHVLNGAGGGAAMSTIALMDALRARGVDSSAVCLEAGNEREREALVAATRGKTLFTPLYVWNSKIRAALWKRPLIEAMQLARTGFGRASAARVAAFAVKHQIDLIHTNTLLTPEGGLVGRWLGRPHVWHLRELVGPGHPFRLPYEGRRLGRYLSRHCSKLVANSYATAEVVRSSVPAGLLEIVQNGIEMSSFKARSTYANDRRLVVAMVGSLTSQWKKHALFIRAAAGVQSRDVEFRIYGHAPSSSGYVADLRRLVGELGLEDRFVWPGFVPDPSAVMEQIDILVHPADQESFGRIVVEGMAAGLPVVGVNAGGVGEIVQDGVTGILASPDDHLGLARGIDRMIADPDLRARLGTAGRARVEARYSIDACANGILRVYGAAMNRPLKLLAPAEELS